jgi:hypothetical protein
MTNKIDGWERFGDDFICDPGGDTKHKITVGVDFVQYQNKRAEDGYWPRSCVFSLRLIEAMLNRMGYSIVEDPDALYRKK